MIYVAETHTGRVRRIEPDGAISSVTSVHEYVGEAPVTVAAVASGADGSLYVAAGGAVLRVYPDGAVVTVAGGGISQEPPDTLPQATTAALALAPGALATGPNGTLYMADAQHGQLFRLDRDGLTAIVKYDGLSGVLGMAVDSAGNVYLAEQSGNVVRKVTPDGAISVFAGTGDASYNPDAIGDGGPATEAAVISPKGLAVAVTSYEPADMLAFDAHGNLYFSETQRNRVRVLVRPGEFRHGVSPAVLITGAGS